MIYLSGANTIHREGADAISQGLAQNQSISKLDLCKFR